jgi:hypothetical protein
LFPISRRPDATGIDPVDEKFSVAVPDLPIGFRKRLDLHVACITVEKDLRIGGFHCGLPCNPGLARDRGANARVEIGGRQPQQFWLFRPEGLEDRAFCLSKTHRPKAKCLKARECRGSFENEVDRRAVGAPAMDR